MKMPKFQETSKELLYAHCDDLINDEEFYIAMRYWHF